MIEPVGRSFAILEALSRRPHGTVAALAEETGYRLSDKVLGLTHNIRFVDVAAPHMSRFTHKYGWPLYLGVHRDAARLWRQPAARPAV